MIEHKSRPSPLKPEYTAIRAEELLAENERLSLPHRGAFVHDYVELEAEAERLYLICEGRVALFSSLYYLLGLPASILAAVAGGTALASTTGVPVAGVLALISSCLTGAVTFLDSSKQLEKYRRLRAFWASLREEMHTCRLTQLPDFTVVSGPRKLSDFHEIAAAIRNGRDPSERPIAPYPDDSGTHPRRLFESDPS